MKFIDVMGPKRKEASVYVRVRLNPIAVESLSDRYMAEIEFSPKLKINNVTLLAAIPRGLGMAVGSFFQKYKKEDWTVHISNELIGGKFEENSFMRRNFRSGFKVATYWIDNDFPEYKPIIKKEVK